jgi:hypothetical protein
MVKLLPLFNIFLLFRKRFFALVVKYLLGLTIIITFFGRIATAQTLQLSPLYNSIGITVSNITTTDSCRVEYKPAGQTNWLLAYPPDKIQLNGIDQFRGSIFLLQEQTTYEVRATLFTGGIGTKLPVSQSTTLTSPSFKHTANVKWVSPNGMGNYTPSNPGNVATLFSSGQVSCGTTIVFTNGIYSVSELQLNLAGACTDNTSIVLTAAPGANPIIDGGKVITTSWTPDANVPNLYYTSLPASAAYSTTCLLGKKLLYPYPTLTANSLFGNYHLNALSFGLDGFVRNANTIWIKTQSGINPNDSVVTVSTAWRFLTVYGNNNNIFLKVKGLTFRNFGKPQITPFGSSQDAFSATVFDIRNAHHIYFDSCRFDFNIGNISFSGECNHITIQNSNFRSDAGKWTHAMLKKSTDHFFFETSSRGRNVETEAIFVEKGKSICLRGNNFNGTNSGIQSYTEQGLKEEIDIYNNTFIDCFDAIECDGQWSNLRAWKNEIYGCMAGFSAAPPLIGPRYFYRNLVHGMKGRRNVADDPYFIGCAPVGTNYMTQATGIKTNPLYTGGIPKGNLYFFNNTFHSADTLGFVFTSWEAEWRKAVFINNCYAHENNYPMFHFNLANSSANRNFQISSEHDNYYTYNNAPITKVKHIHGQYTCTDIFNVGSLQSTLTNLSGSNNILIKNPMQTDPAFVTKAIKGFELKSSSPLINQGKLIQGFYDYNGPSPDIGAKEYILTSAVANVELDDVQIFPNPSADKFYIKGQMINHIKIYNLHGQHMNCAINFWGSNLVVDASNLTHGVYFVEVSTNNKTLIKKIMKCH